MFEMVIGHRCDYQLLVIEVFEMVTDSQFGYKINY